jgi:pilus assembly protein CpaF
MSTDFVERVRRRLAAAGAEITVAAVASAVREEAGGVAGDADVLDALRLLQQEFVGAGPLEPLLRDPGTTDVLVTRPDQVWVDGDAGLRRSDVVFADEAAVRRLAQRLAVAAGRRLDDAQPYVDAWLPGSGVRLHAVLPPVAPEGTCLSLRVLRPAVHDLDALRRLGTVDDQGMDLVRTIIDTRLAFVVVGPTGSGKTTLLSAMLGCVPANERIVCVEDAGELRPDHPQFVRLVARPPNIEGAGAVQVRDLVRQALRMRPDRVVVGEVRGAEVCELLAALNTGHDGVWCGDVARQLAAGSAGPVRGIGRARWTVAFGAAQPTRRRGPGRIAHAAGQRRIPATGRGRRARTHRRPGPGRSGVASR